MHAFNYCSEEKFPIENSTGYLRRIKIVAGKLSPGEEAHCGSFPYCAVYISWADEFGNVVNFFDPPHLMNDDPAVRILGCDEFCHSCKVPTPQVVKYRSELAWKMHYQNRLKAQDSNRDYAGLYGCELSGDVYHLPDIIISTLKVDRYFYFCRGICPKGFDFEKSRVVVPYPVESDYLKAIATKNPKQCRFTVARDKDAPDSIHRLCMQPKKALIEKTDRKDWDSACEYKFRKICLENYISATGDTSLCGQTLNIDYPLKCEEIRMVSREDPTESSPALFTRIHP